MNERIGFGRRFAAALIDGIVIGIIGVVGGAVAASLLLPPATHHVTSGEDWAALGEFARGMLIIFVGPVLGLFAVSCLWIVWEGLTGQSLGKKLLRIRINSADGSVARPTQLFLRVAVKYSPVLVLILPRAVFALGFGLRAVGIMTSPVVLVLAALAGLVVMAGCFLMLGPRRQALHDLLAKTAVYEA